jgi:NDP-sugar pyrophosphorylase family protein
MFNNSVIIAGGNGSRMRPLTDYIPKALVKVDGVPLIDNSINLLSKYNINIYVTYNYLSNILLEKINSKVKGFINTINQDNSYFLFNSFIKSLNEPIVVIPCDLKIKLDLVKVYEDYLNNNSPSIMVIGTTPVNGIDGDYITYDENNNITFLDRNNKTEKYCSGVQIINPHKVNQLHIENNNFYGVWNSLIEKKELKISNVYPDFWYSYDDIKQVK